MTLSNSIIIPNALPIDIEANTNDADMPFDSKILSSIIQRTAVAATDALVKDYNMGGCWIIVNVAKSVKKENMICHKQ